MCSCILQFRKTKSCQIFKPSLFEKKDGQSPMKMSLFGGYGFARERGNKSHSKFFTAKVGAGPRGFSAQRQRAGANWKGGV
jgi:hypothetical protein